MLGLVDPCWKCRITVKIIAPGPVEHLSDMNEAIEQTKQFPKKKIKISPQDISEMITFPCEDAGRYLTDNVIESRFRLFRSRIFGESLEYVVQSAQAVGSGLSR